MLVPEETVVKVLADLTKGGREFHTAELATRLSDEVGMPIQSDVARYWANQMVLRGMLERRQISSRLFVYHKRKGVDLSASVTVRPHEETDVRTENPRSRDREVI